MGLKFNINKYAVSDNNVLIKEETVDKRTPANHTRKKQNIKNTLSRENQKFLSLIVAGGAVSVN